MPGLVRGVARTAAIAGTASAVSGRVHHRQQGKWAAQEAAAAPPQQAYAQPQYAPPPPAYAPPPPAAPEPDMDTKLAHLKELASLHDAGVLTDEEFYAQKAKILG